MPKIVQNTFELPGSTDLNICFDIFLIIKSVFLVLVAFHRALDPENVAVSIDTLNRVAAALGKRLKIEPVDCT
ncbi:MAG: hypothetical protein WCF85_10455 [Rhodospirillaceae bacterium]